MGLEQLCWRGSAEPCAGSNKQRAWYREGDRFDLCRSRSKCRLVCIQKTCGVMYLPRARTLSGRRSSNTCSVPSRRAKWSRSQPPMRPWALAAGAPLPTRHGLLPARTRRSRRDCSRPNDTIEIRSRELGRVLSPRARRRADRSPGMTTCASCGHSQRVRHGTPRACHPALRQTLQKLMAVSAFQLGLLGTVQCCSLMTMSGANSSAMGMTIFWNARR